MEACHFIEKVCINVNYLTLGREIREIEHYLLNMESIIAYIFPTLKGNLKVICSQEHKEVKLTKFILKDWLIYCVAAAKSLQLCPTLCDPIDGSPPGSPVPGILKARTLEWVAISFSNAWEWKVKARSLTHVRLLATPRTVAHQARPSMGFSRQEYWSEVPLPTPNLLCYMMLLSFIFQVAESKYI